MCKLLYHMSCSTAVCIRIMLIPIKLIHFVFKIIYPLSSPNLSSETRCYMQSQWDMVSSLSCSLLEQKQLRPLELIALTCSSQIFLISWELVTVIEKGCIHNQQISKKTHHTFLYGQILLCTKDFTSYVCDVLDAVRDFTHTPCISQRWKSCPSCHSNICDTIMLQG